MHHHSTRSIQNINSDRILVFFVGKMVFVTQGCFWFSTIPPRQLGTYTLRTVCGRRLSSFSTVLWCFSFIEEKTCTGLSMQFYSTLKFSLEIFALFQAQFGFQTETYNLQFFVRITKISIHTSFCDEYFFTISLLFHFPSAPHLSIQSICRYMVSTT